MDIAILVLLRPCSSSFSAFSVSASNLITGSAIDPSDIIVVKLEEPDPNDGSPSMTHSSLIRMEANQQMAAQPCRL
jgi:hypothetical protein